MFRAYKQAQVDFNQAGDSKGESPTGNESDHSDEFDSSMQNEVKRVWSDIEKQCQDKESSPKEGNNTSRTMVDSNTVRVFVSSTFTDFFNEREVLVKKIFPELKEWCQGRGQKLLECDLRWGIPTDTSTSDTILVCLDEIEKCIEINKGQPFFINLVGERYGWIPSAEETPDEAREKYGWIDGTSITFMEILHGAYRDKNPNAAFFLRGREVLDGVPESFHSRFVDKEPIARLHLKTMKRKIQERFPTQVFPYSCKFKQISVSTGREQVELTDLDEFAEKVIRFLKSAIERTYPYSPKSESQNDLQSQEKDLQLLFALDKAKDLIGRASELEILKDFVENGTSACMEKTDMNVNKWKESSRQLSTGERSSYVRERERWELEESDNAICVLEGLSGWGKTALMCRLIVDTINSGARVFFHIVNSTPTSVDVETLLRDLLAVLVPEEAEERKDGVESKSVEDLQLLLKTALAKYRNNSDQKLVIFIDGLNELESSETYAHLAWLPPTFPHNIHCVVSANPHPPTTARLYEHPAFKMTLQRMTSEDLTAVAVQYLQAFSKKLDASLLERLISKTGVDNPLWMLMMIEELRIFGDFRVLKDKIDKLPNTMEELLVHIIDRLIQEDDENEVIKKVLCLTACSRQGLPADSILKICGNMETKEELAPLYWARAHRQLKPYFRVFGSTEEVLTFSHEAVLKAVQSHLLNPWQETTKWHTALADYYQFWCDNGRAKAYHLPYHLEAARLKQRIVDFIRKDPDSYTFINPWSRSTFAKKARCHMTAKENTPSTAPMMLCHRCSLGHRGYNPACTWQNKTCCVLCGSHCFGSKTVGARVCSRHRFKYGNKCVLCSHMVTSTGNQAQLCNNCTFGSGDRTCACYDV